MTRTRGPKTGATIWSSSISERRKAWGVKGDAVVAQLASPSLFQTAPVYVHYGAFMTPTAQDPESDNLSADELRLAWPVFSRAERVEAFHLLRRVESEDLYLGLSARDQFDLLDGTAPAERRSWMRLLPPDDAADLVQVVPEERRAELLALLDDPTRKEVTALLAHAEDRAGGLMDPRYARLRPDMNVDEAVRYLREQLREQKHTLVYAYVVDADQMLLGVVPFWQLFVQPGHLLVRDFMRKGRIGTAAKDA